MVVISSCGFILVFRREALFCGIGPSIEIFLCFPCWGARVVVEFMDVGLGACLKSLHGGVALVMICYEFRVRGDWGGSEEVSVWRVKGGSLFTIGVAIRDTCLGFAWIWLGTWSHFKRVQGEC